nr:retrovirus-related Pol polyprotein from transposon TNT 1-94 [Tanacetum cinerariifolium]
MKMFLNGATYVITDVYFIPELKNNLLSIGQLQQKGNDEKMLEDFKASMKTEFEMTDLGKMRYFLGIEVVQNPAETHLAAAKRVMRYIQGTLDFGIWYKRGGKGKMEVFTDSDFVGDLTDRKSTSGNVILWDGAAVSWSSKKQSIVALSSTEAEYVAAASCACQVIWVRELLEELGIHQVADIFTKPLHRDIFQGLRERLGVHSLKGKQDIET